MVRRGTYFLDAPLTLEPEDSRLTISAYGTERPVLSGGQSITGWGSTKVGGRTTWVAEVPEARQGNWKFHALWVNGRRAVRARHPNRGYFKVAEVPDQVPEWSRGQTRFRFSDGDLKAWNTVTNAEVVVMSRWVESRLPVRSVDPAERLVEFGKRSVFRLEPGDPYYLEGAFEALDEPGEWWLDEITGKLYYLPRPGENLRNVEVIAPKLMQLLRLEGRPEQGRFVERLKFRGLTFCHNEWYFPEGFERGRAQVTPAPEAGVGGFAQAAFAVPGAVWGRGVRQCTWENCRFAHLGSYGLELAGGCSGNRVLGCGFADLGAGGLKVGETEVRSEPSEQCGDNEISDCSIFDGGKIFHSAVGIWIGQSTGNRLTHNLIHDFYYTGISIGWTWGYGTALATNNLVAFNHVHHIGVRSNGDGPILSDMGGIYTLGMQPGTRIINNLWHDIAGLKYGGWGIYFDEGSSSILARSNIVYGTTHGGFHQHYGATNLVENNIFAFGRDHQLQRSRVEARRSFSFTTNIVYFDHGVLLGGTWAGDQYTIDWNDYWDARPGAKPAGLRFAGATLAQWQARGHDRHSIVANPRFFAPRRGAFGLRQESPALKLGFRPIDLSSVGPRRSATHAPPGVP